MTPTSLFPYQQEGVALLSAFQGRALLADEMGLGKTIQALTWAVQNKTYPIVVVCPAGLKLNWEREALKHLNLRAHVLEGRRVPRRRIGPQAKLLIVNYDILGNWIQFLRDMEPGIAIIDECHYIKSRKAKRTRHVRKLCDGIRHLIALSGTPLTNRPAELWAILNLIRPDLYGSFPKFAWRYCKPQLKPWGFVYQGATHLPELHESLKQSCMIRRLKRDVLKDLPDKARHLVLLPLSNQKEYQHAVTDFLGWLRKNKTGRQVRRAKRAEALAKMGYLKRLAGELKLPATMEWIDNFLNDTNEKLIVFGLHRAVLQPMRERYRNISVLINGATPKHKRQLAVDEFQHNKRTRLFLGNIQAAGVGHTLTAASTVAFAEFTWTPGEHIQAEDRAHRIGQHKKVSCYYLASCGTIEEKLCQILQEKQGILDATLDGRDPQQTDLDIFNQLLKEFTP